MRFAILALLATVLLGGGSEITRACPPADIGCDYSASGEVFYVFERDQWRQLWSFVATCDSESTGVHRNAHMIWRGPEAQAADSLAAKADAFAARLVLYWQIESVDYYALMNQATSVLVQADINPALDDFVTWLKTAGSPSVGTMATQWRTRFGELTWIQTSEQADSLLYRIADSFGMTGVGLLNWMKANAAWLE